MIRRPPRSTRTDTLFPYTRSSDLYALTEQLNAYATYSVGEKSGLSGVDNPGSVPPYAKIKPEENDAYELGLKYAASRLTANLSMFSYDYKNKQEQGFTDLTVFIQNTDPVNLKSEQTRVGQKCVMTCRSR